MPEIARRAEVATSTRRKTTTALRAMVAPAAVLW